VPPQNTLALTARVRRGTLPAGRGGAGTPGRLGTNEELVRFGLFRPSRSSPIARPLFRTPRHDDAGRTTNAPMLSLLTKMANEYCSRLYLHCYLLLDDYSAQPI
jgi:hypothetical protein